MEKYKRNIVLWQSLLSVSILGIFILFATGSRSLFDYFGLEVGTKSEYLGNEVWKDTEKHQYKHLEKITTGRKDENRLWDGKITILWDEGLPTGYKEEVYMEHGTRQGLSIRTFPDGRKVEEHYLNGIKYEYKKSAKTGYADRSAYQILNDKYPWLAFTLNAYSYKNEFVKAYMDTLETVLNKFQFNISQFNDYYDDALDVLSKTSYDTIITGYSNLFVSQGLDELKKSVFRLAVIDHLRSSNSPTYNIVNTIYLGYLETMNKGGVNNTDFEGFCKVMDDNLKAYGPLDQNDPYFVDSVDARLFRSLFSILDPGKSDLSSKIISIKSSAPDQTNSGINEVIKKYNYLFRSFSLASTPSEVAGVVTSDMLTENFYQGDIIRKAVFKAYTLRKGLVNPPASATVFLKRNSPSSIALDGYVIDDGGSAVTSRGVVWATYFNPTKKDNMISGGTGTGKFSISLTGLTEGTTYYARAYATNNAGTSYGNGISYNSNITTGTGDVKNFGPGVIIYPNPSSGLTTFDIQVNLKGNMILAIINMKGQVVIQKKLYNSCIEDTQVALDLSLLSNGIYTCRLMIGTTTISRMFIIENQ